MKREFETNVACRVWIGRRIAFVRLCFSSVREAIPISLHLHCNLNRQFIRSQYFEDYNIAVFATVNIVLFLPNNHKKCNNYNIDWFVNDSNWLYTSARLCEHKQTIKSTLHIQEKIKTSVSVIISAARFSQTPRWLFQLHRDCIERERYRCMVY